MNEPDPQFPHPQVTHVTVVRLDRRDYAAGRDVLDHLQQQARHIPDGAVVAVHLGRRALQVRPVDLERQIAGAFFLAAKAIDVHVPGGTPNTGYLVANIQRYVREMREDHARMLRDTG